VVHISGLSNGVYFVKMDCDNELPRTFKFVKK
jgi:hypothetical protein